LCNFINTIKPGSVTNINTKPIVYMERENVSNYLEACKKLGMNKVDLFDAGDLYDQRNIVSVINHFYALSGFVRGIKGFKGPFMEGGLSQAVKVDITGGAPSGPAHGNKVYIDKPDDNDYVLGDLDRDLQNKIKEKYDPEKDQEVLQWIQSVLNKRLKGDLGEALHSGIEMCQLLNIIFPGAVGSINVKETSFAQRENISKYLEACKKVGLKLVDLFDTQDLYDCKNIPSVINHFYSLSSFARQNAKRFSGPFIGVKFSSENKRDFTDEQMNKGKFVASQQTQGSLGAYKDDSNGVKLDKIIKDINALK